jgi:hypothetical protein
MIKRKDLLSKGIYKLMCGIIDINLETLTVGGSLPSVVITV